MNIFITRELRLMEKETKLTLLCRRNQEAEDDFKILINDEEINYGFLSIISYSVDSYAEGIGPFYAVAEGRLAVTGDASIEIKLLGNKINKIKRLFFQIKPKENVFGQKA